MKKNFYYPLVLSAALLAFSACGKQEYAVQASVETQTAPGTFEIPAKVDILMGWDNTGSMHEVYNQVAAQIPTFLNDLENKGWDYHFAATPMTVSRLDHITASHHDSNYGSAWTPPFPGAIAGGPGTLSSSFFMTLAAFANYGFPAFGDVSNADNGFEPGLNTLADVLTNKVGGTGFLRSDAMLVMIALSTGDDTSGMTYCNRGDGVVIPCAGSTPSNVSSFTAQFLGLKNNDIKKVRFYSAVNQSASYPTSCMGDVRPRIGTRYSAMAAALGGSAIDICQNSLSSTLTQMATQLTSTRLSMRTRYLFISQSPEPTSIVVTRLINGDPNQPVIIPQDAANGWSYEGMQSVYAIDFPTNMNMTTGFAIRLNGSSALLGNDSASITYRPLGSQTTVTQ